MAIVSYPKTVIKEGIIIKKSEPISESYFYILLCLSKGPTHGYGIMQMTKQLTGGEVTIGSGTMYGATDNMLTKGWIEETFSEETGVEKKRLYRLTAKGFDVLDKEIRRLKRMIANTEEL